MSRCSRTRSDGVSVMRAKKQSNDGQNAEQPERRAGAWVTLAIAAAIASVAVIGPSAQGRGQDQGQGKGRARVDRELTDRMKRRNDSERERVIVTAKPGRLGRLLEQLKSNGADVSNDLSFIDGVAGELPVGLLRKLAEIPTSSASRPTRRCGRWAWPASAALRRPRRIHCAPRSASTSAGRAHVPTGGQRLLRRSGRQRRQPGADRESRRPVVRVDGRRVDGLGGHAGALRRPVRERREPDSVRLDDHVGLAQGRTLLRWQQQRDRQPASDADPVVRQRELELDDRFRYRDSIRQRRSSSERRRHGHRPVVVIRAHVFECGSDRDRAGVGEWTAQQRLGAVAGQHQRLARANR